MEELLLGLDELDTISERIAKFKASEAGNGDRIEDRYAAAFQMSFPICQIGHLIGDVRLGGEAMDIFFDADVKLMLSCRKPKPAARLQRRRFGDFAQAQHIAIEQPRRLQVGSGDGDLRVMESQNRAGRWHVNWRRPPSRPS